MVTLSLLWLRYQRAGTRLTKSAHPIEHYQNMMSATIEETTEAERLGNELLVPINIEVDNLIYNLNSDKIKICEIYLAYYHVADGGFFFEFGKRKLANGKTALRILPRWTIVDDKLAEPVLKRIVRQYNFSNYQYISHQKSGYARANGWEKASQVVIPFFVRQKRLPDVTSNKVKTFINVCNLHFNDNTYRNAKLFRIFVKQAYFLNASPQRTKEKFEKDYKSLMEEIIIDKQMQDQDP